MSDRPEASFEELAQRAHDLAQSGQALQAEALFRHLLERHPDHPDLLTELASLALLRDDITRAQRMLQRALRGEPQHVEAALELARLLARKGEAQDARQVLEACLRVAPRAHPEVPMAWLMLGALRDALDDGEGAARAWHTALERARARGRWQTPEDTPEPLRQPLEAARLRAREAREAWLDAAIAPLRARASAESLVRIDEAKAVLLGRSDRHPPHPRQRPKFLYVPGLPSQPYLDPDLMPWASRLRKAFVPIRQEALQVLREREGLAGFIDVRPGDRIENYLGGSAERPAWDAFFFYRHGKRYDANHARCPVTSEVLESLDLFRLEGQAPEICFSVLAPHTTIRPHHGVSNVRLVMHLPLIVPADCALNLVDVGEHAWREGELVLFDDTFEHEAWNRSAQPRVVLLMDCWNPHLSGLEREAVTALIQASSAFDQAL